MDPNKYNAIAGCPSDVMVLVGPKEQPFHCHQKFLSKCSRFKAYFDNNKSSTSNNTKRPKTKGVDNIHKHHSKNHNKRTGNDKEIDKNADDTEREENKYQELEASKGEEENEKTTLIPTIRLPMEHPLLFLRFAHYLYTSRYPITTDDPANAPYIHLHLFNMSVRFGLVSLPPLAVYHAKLSMFTRNPSTLDADTNFEILGVEKQISYLTLVWCNGSLGIHEGPGNNMKKMIIESIVYDNVEVDVRRVAVKVPAFHEDLTVALLDFARSENDGDAESEESDGEWRLGDSSDDEMDIELSGNGGMRTRRGRVVTQTKDPVVRKLDYT